MTDTSGTLRAMAATTCPASPAEVSRSCGGADLGQRDDGRGGVPPSFIVTPLSTTSSTGAPAASVVRVMTTVAVRVWPSTVRAMPVPETRRYGPVGRSRVTGCADADGEGLDDGAGRGVDLDGERAGERDRRDGDGDGAGDPARQPGRGRAAARPSRWSPRAPGWRRRARG